MINWNRSLNFPELLRDSQVPNKASTAMKFLAYVCKPRILAKVAEPTNYGPINSDAYKFISPAVAKLLPGSPETVKLGQVVDATARQGTTRNCKRSWAKLSVR